MDKKGEKRYIVALNLVTGDSITTVSKKAIANFLGINVKTVDRNLHQVSYYQCVKYIIVKDSLLVKCDRKLSVIAKNVHDTLEYVRHSSKPVRELTYEPFFD